MSFGRKGLILGRAENGAKIAGKGLGNDARSRAFAKESDPMPPKQRRPVRDLGRGRLPNAACGHDQKSVHVYKLCKTPDFLEKQGLIVHY
jgi:hypothetical protein